MTATMTEGGTLVVGPAERGPGFGAVLRAEWLKLRTVRSTWWTLVATFVLGAGLTVLLCWANADWLASADADESPGSFVTWGMMIAQITAVVLGALVVTTEYGTGMVRSTFAAVPARGRVLAAKSLLLVTVLLVVGTVTALVGYAGGNYFLDREGIGYDVVDIEQDPAAADVVMAANNGNQTVPTLVYSDGTAQTNPSVAQVKAKLASL